MREAGGHSGFLNKTDAVSLKPRLQERKAERPPGQLLKAGSLAPRAGELSSSRSLFWSCFPHSIL